MPCKWANWDLGKDLTLQDKENTSLLMKVNATLGSKNENYFVGGQFTHGQVLFFGSENKVTSEGERN